MKITLLSENAIRLDPVPGMVSVEAPTEDTMYSPFHMMASGLASCTFSVLHSWASQAKISVDNLSIEIRWTFSDDPHRVANYSVIFAWPALPANRIVVAKRVAAMCTVHATLMHPPQIDILSSTEAAAKT